MPLPLATSSSRLANPWTRLAPLVSLVRLTTSGLVSAKLRGRDGVQILVEQEADHRLAAARRRRRSRPDRAAARRRADRRRGARGNRDRPAIRRRRSGGRAAFRRPFPHSAPVQKSPHCCAAATCTCIRSCGRMARPIANSLVAWAMAKGSNGRVGLASPSSSSRRPRSGGGSRSAITGGSAPGRRSFA